ncbi:tetratricopeptide repeat protein [Micromonospora sp. DSM 115977]|uniref:Tetratricopeptide repeat protein n=1 Tax=Micromonospora reichwaldensis TaxID=3075516 RepID=A0ABU2X0P8_9ACTN|nr:tetratricopeptide repeat protein [Micromonospora sp. DSM 115977]MDT0531221.1 tetratricopeptide repeat protein [Micromonospora sp. DSM 115977]
MDLLAEYRRATMFFEAGDPTGAARLLEPIVEAEPGNASVRQLLARAYFQSAQLNRAEAQLRELIDRDPADHYAHHVLGRTLERLSRHADALRHLRIAAAMDSGNDDYRTALDRVQTRVEGTR